MDEITILLMPNFDQTRQQLIIKKGGRFSISEKWESAAVQCEGVLMRLLPADDWEDEEEDNQQIYLTSGTYLFNNDGITIEKINDEIEDGWEDDLDSDEY